MDELDDIAGVGKALSAPARLMLLAALTVGDLCVTDLTALVDLRQSAVSKHLAVLRRTGLVEPVRDGKRMVYQLSRPGPSGFAATALAGLVDVRRKDPEIRRICERARELARTRG